MEDKILESLDAQLKISGVSEAESLGHLLDWELLLGESHQVITNQG